LRYLFKKLLLFGYFNLVLAHKIGVIQYFRYKFNYKSVISIKIKNFNVYIRKKTPDMNVALESLGGEFRILSDFFNSDYRGLIIDAGGYIGTASLKFNSMFPKATIITIEPSEENLNILKKNLSRISNVTILKGALLTTTNEYVSLYSNGNGEWGHSVIASPLNVSYLENVKSYLLSDLVEKDFTGIIKLDIEGSEKDLFVYQSEILNKFKLIVVELHERYNPGTEKAYSEFNKINNRISFKLEGEKYVSISRDIKEAL